MGRDLKGYSSSHKLITFDDGSSQLIRDEGSEIYDYGDDDDGLKSEDVFHSLDGRSQIKKCLDSSYELHMRDSNDRFLWFSQHRTFIGAYAEFLWRLNGS